MGHERVGALPRTKRWQDVVGGIADAVSVDGNIGGLANATLENVRSRLLAIQGGTGFVASFQFLLGLSLSASPGVDRASLGKLAIDLEGNPSPVKLASALGQYVADNTQSAEYAEIAPWKPPVRNLFPQMFPHLMWELGGYCWCALEQSEGDLAVNWLIH